MKNLSRCDLLNKKKNMCTFQTNIGNTSQLDFLKHSYGIFINLSSLLFHYIASCRFYYCKKINVGSVLWFLLCACGSRALRHFSLNSTDLNVWMLLFGDLIKIFLCFPFYLTVCCVFFGIKRLIYKVSVSIFN